MKYTIIASVEERAAYGQLATVTHGPKWALGYTGWGDLPADAVQDLAQRLRRMYPTHVFDVRG